MSCLLVVHAGGEIHSIHAANQPTWELGAAGGQALDDAGAEPLAFLDQQARFLHRRQRTAQEVLLRRGDTHPLRQPPPEAQERVGRRDVAGE